MNWLYLLIPYFGINFGILIYETGENQVYTVYESVIIALFGTVLAVFAGVLNIYFYIRGKT